MVAKVKERIMVNHSACNEGVPQQPWGCTPACGFRVVRSLSIEPKGPPPGTALRSSIE
jgi:hypothetical protein